MLLSFVMDSKICYLLQMSEMFLAHCKQTAQICCTYSDLVYKTFEKRLSRFPVTNENSKIKRVTFEEYFNLSLASFQTLLNFHQNVVFVFCGGL